MPVDGCKGLPGGVGGHDLDAGNVLQDCLHALHDVGLIVDHKEARLVHAPGGGPSHF